MIIRAGTINPEIATSEHDGRKAVYSTEKLSDGGGISQYGARVQALEQGARSSKRHWHEKEDECLFMLSGEAILVENDGEHIFHPGDAACWPAGIPNAHHLINRSSQACSYLVAGTRSSCDVCHYPDSGRTLYTQGEDWRVENNGGTVLRSGKS
ncbi:MAG: cupin domain-containing protein [Pseudomonadales bacterium]|nr:cupin domain-containing protein [Pseudomonadales bacterium]MCP5183704.1 cupin domain-containing protein [Pseudomonadales bacterium]